MRFSAVRAIGADHVVDYTQEDFTWTGQGYDLILEMAGNRSLVDLRHASPSRGRWCSLEDRAVGGSWGPAAPSERWSCPRSSASGFAHSCPSHRSGPGCSEGAPRGRQAHPGDRPNRPLSETPEAISYVGERSTQGKPVITV